MDMEKILKDLEDVCEYIRTSKDIGSRKARMMDKVTFAIALLKEQEATMQCIKGKCRICPYCANCDVDKSGLIKEQEAVEPIMMDHIVFGTGRKCSKCNRYLFPAGEYCPHCGRKVNWDA